MDADDSSAGIESHSEDEVTGYVQLTKRRSDLGRQFVFKAILQQQSPVNTV